MPASDQLFTNAYCKLSNKVLRIKYSCEDSELMSQKNETVLGKFKNLMRLKCGRFSACNSMGQRWWRTG